ncbi:MAG: Beta-hydroxyacyl-(acyl-carrier-protein) dehydratase FabA/FabZ [Puniceicoccaceae bacterium 5H]|nr:MAG: Beta-hydroxyacyl-(acyl-carrier-protein) dehydratase FabA/FabZ [Puniceicoccaceae bacterium 5H]
MSQSTLKEQELRESLKRCSERTIEAAIVFQNDRNPELIPTIVLGIVERFADPEVRPKIWEGGDDVRLMEDLGIDSLLLVEIVMLTEEVLGISIENEELRHLRTLGDVKRYLDAKIKGEPIELANQKFTFEQLLTFMPHQPPFLFLHDAAVTGETAEGSYRISGQEEFLEGHFRGNPVFPASLMLEALGQLAVFYLLKSDKPELKEQVDPGSIYFLSAEGIRCHRLCRPQDTLQFQVKLLRVHAPLAQFSGTITCNGVKVAKVEELALSIAAFSSDDEMSSTEQPSSL